MHLLGFPGGSNGKESAYNAGDPDSTPGLGRSPGEGNGNTLQYSCLENSMDRGTWQATVHGVTRSRIEQLLLYFLGSSGDSAVKNLPIMQEVQETRVNPWVGKMP